jgi:PIN domain nuclease of toxin-antitoxin system
LATFAVEIVPLDQEQAVLGGSPQLARHGDRLSLADRSCLALAQSLRALVVTVDRTWNNLGLGIDIEVVR